MKLKFAAFVLCSLIILSFGASSHSQILNRGAQNKPQLYELEDPEYETNIPLSEFASIFAMRKVRVECPRKLDRWIDDAQAAWGAIGYTTLDWDFMVIGWIIRDSRYFEGRDVNLCAAALSARETDPRQMKFSDRHRAIGIATIIHEAYHLRLWNWRKDEGRVECQSIRHFVIGVQLLGGTYEMAMRLRPHAIKEYWGLAQIAPEYYWAGCIVPEL